MSDYINPNLPYIKRNTFIISWLYICSGLNCLITSIFFSANSEVQKSFLSMGLLLLFITPIVIRDNRSEEKNRTAVITTYGMHFLISVFCLGEVPFNIISLIYVVELLMLFVVIKVLKL